MSKLLNVRRHWRGGLLLAGLMCMLAMAIPSSASAQYVPCGVRYDPANPCGYIPDDVHPWAGFQGWGYVKAPNACPVGAQCFVGASTPAWRWNGAWSRASLFGNTTEVYIYPYAVGWSWVWTQNTGWLAVSDSYVYVRRAHIAYAL